MREAAASALIQLYSSDDNVSPLHAFTSRFSSRFAELVYDIEESVAVKGVSLLHSSLCCLTIQCTDSLIQVLLGFRTALCCSDFCTHNRCCLDTCSNAQACLVN